MLILPCAFFVQGSPRPDDDYVPDPSLCICDYHCISGSTNIFYEVLGSVEVHCWMFVRRLNRQLTLDFWMELESTPCICMFVTLFSVIGAVQTILFYTWHELGVFEKKLRMACVENLLKHNLLFVQFRKLKDRALKRDSTWYSDSIQQICK